MKSRYDKMCDRWILVYLAVAIATAVLHAYGLPITFLTVAIAAPVLAAATFTGALVVAVGVIAAGYLFFASVNLWFWLTGQDHRVEWP